MASSPQSTTQERIEQARARLISSADKINPSENIEKNIESHGLTLVGLAFAAGFIVGYSKTDIRQLLSKDTLKIIQNFL